MAQPPKHMELEIKRASKSIGSVCGAARFSARKTIASLWYCLTVKGRGVQVADGDGYCAMSN
jgi:hypothetical protein